MYFHFSSMEGMGVVETSINMQKRKGCYFELFLSVTPQFCFHHTQRGKSVRDLYGALLLLINECYAHLQILSVFQLLYEETQRGDPCHITCPNLMSWLRDWLHHVLASTLSQLLSSFCHQATYCLIQVIDCRFIKSIYFS